MKLLCVPWPSLPRAVKASCSEQMEMEGSRLPKERACPPVPDRDSERIRFFDRGDDVSIEIHQFETESLHLAPDKVQSLIEKSAAVRCDRLFGQLFQSFASVINHLLGTQSQLIHDEPCTGFPARCGNNFLHTNHLQDLDCG